MSTPSSKGQPPDHTTGPIPVLAVGLLLCAVFGVEASAAQVVVDANTAVSLGGQEEISSNLFGLTAFEGFPGLVSNRDRRGEVAAMRPGCFRFPGPVSWFAPKDYDPSWYDGPDAARAFERTLLHGARYPLGRFLPVVRQMGAEPMVSLGSPPPYLRYEETPNPSDFDRWAETCAAFVGLWRKFDPGLRLVQIWNEPNASWYKDPRVRDHGKGTSMFHIEMANKVARAVKKRFPDILIGGPVLCWPPGWPPAQKGKPPWYTWHEWTLPWLEHTKDTVDFFDFHDYYAKPEELTVQVEMLFNAALGIQGRRLPIWITESNAGLGSMPAEKMWRDRVLAYERVLLRCFLPQADKIAGNLYHDLSARAHSLWAGPYHLFWLLRDLRGTRVVADSDDADVVAFATVEEDRTTIVLFNDSDEAEDVELKLGMPCGWWTGPAARGIGEGADGQCTRIPIEHKIERVANHAAAGPVSLPPWATASISFHMDRFGAPSRTRRIDEYFGDRTVESITDKPVAVTIDVPEVQGTQASLRIGLLGPEEGDQLAARLNGAHLAIAAVPLQEIVLGDGQIGRSNKLEIHLGAPTGNAKLALGFASIVVQSAPKDRERRP